MQPSLRMIEDVSTPLWFSASLSLDFAEIKLPFLLTILGLHIYCNTNYMTVLLAR